MTEPLLAVPCAEHCGEAVLVQLPFTSQDLERVLAPKNWVASVISPPGGGSLAVSVLCDKCAKRVLPPVVLAEMKRRRDTRMS